MRTLSIYLTLSLLLFTLLANAQTTESPVIAKVLLEGGIEFGGDEILEVIFTNGGEQTIQAGQGGFIAVGGQFQFPKVKPLMIRTSIGIKYVTTAADNANIRLTRWPIYVSGYWLVTDDIRVGVGAITQQAVRFKGDGFVPDLDLSSNIGPRFELGYKWIALTYSALNYLTEADESVNASSIGIALSFALPTNK